MTIKISDYDALTSAATGDLFEVVDVSDTTMAATGTNKKITLANLIAGIAPNYVQQITNTLGTITTDIRALSATATWNDSGVTFYGVFQNITATASAAASRLIALQAGGSNRFSVDKDGTATFGPGGSTALGAVHVGFDPSTTDAVKIGGNASFGFNFLNSNGYGYFVYNGTAGIGFGGTSIGQIIFKSNGQVRWTASTSIVDTIDLSIGRNADGVMEVNNGTAGTFRDILVRQIFIDGAATSAAAGQISIGADTRTTIGANGGASALTANPVGYIDIYVGSTAYQIPYYTRGA